MQVLIRPATSADAVSIATIWYLGWRDGHLGHVPDELLRARTEASFLERASARVGGTVVAEVEGTVAGFVMAVDDEVEQIYVSQDFRGRGVSDILLADAERQVRHNGHRRTWLAVVAGNLRARRFYERQGWVDGGLFDYEAGAAGGPITVPCHRYQKDL